MKKKKSRGQDLIQFDSKEDYERLKRRDYRLKKTYNISLSEYNFIKEFQEGNCCICYKKSDNLVVDHDHKSGAVRGLLCHSCNVLLGHAKDDVETLQSAINYLKNHTTTYCKPHRFSITFSKTPAPLSGQIFYKNKTTKFFYESHKEFIKSSEDESSTTSQ